MQIDRMMVIGSGQMGSGIAQVIAKMGTSVTLYDVSMERINHGIATIQKSLSKDVQRGKITSDEMSETLNRIYPSTSLQDAQEVQLVIEAVVEKLTVKQDLFRQLDEICPSKTILASNTSSLLITEIASATKRSENVIGMHFMNPVPVMSLIEISRGLGTSEKVVEIVKDFSKRIGKIPIEVNDFPGFISNRILLPMINEAIYCVYEGVAKPEAIDQVMKLGMNHPMGPLALADLIGLDTCLSIMEVLYHGFGDSKYRPCPLLRKYVKAGWMGRKSGRGFYEY